MRTRYLLLTSRKNNLRPFASSSSSSSSVFYLLEASYTRQVTTNRDSSDRLLSRTYSFSFKNEKFEIVRDSTTVYKVKATPSKDRPGQFNVVLFDPISEHVKREKCLVEPDPNVSRSYRIYIENSESDRKLLFGQLSYRLCSYNNYLYTIVIGKKLYTVRSCDLKDRRLAIIDTVESAEVSPSHPYPTFICPRTLFQVIDSFCTSNQVYHVNIHDREKQLGYLALVILLDLHECDRIGSG